MGSAEHDAAFAKSLKSATIEEQEGGPISRADCYKKYPSIHYFDEIVGVIVSDADASRYFEAVLRLNIITPFYSDTQGSRSINAQVCYQWSNDENYWRKTDWANLSCQYRDAFHNHICELISAFEEDHETETDPDVKYALTDIRLRANSVKAQCCKQTFWSAVCRDLIPRRSAPLLVRSLNPISPNLPVKNSLMVDIFTDVVRERTMNDGVTRLCNVYYRPELGTTNAREFLMQLCCDNESHCNFLEEILAVYISGFVRDKTVFIGHGPRGNNGKSTLTNILQAMLGDYYNKLPKAALIEGARSQANSHTAHLNTLAGKRLCVCTELSSTDKINMATIKELRGMENMALRGLNAEYGNVKVSAHFMIFTNSIGNFSEYDPASETSLIIFPMMAHFTDDVTVRTVEEIDGEPTGIVLYPRNGNIEDVVQTDDFLSSCLNVLIEAGVRYAKRGYKFNIPDSIVQYARSIFEDRWPLSDFIRDTCDISTGKPFPVTERVSKKELWDTYCLWLQDHPRAARFAKQSFNTQVVTKYKCPKASTERYSHLKLKSQAIRQSAFSPTSSS